MWNHRLEMIDSDNFNRDQYARDRARIIHSAFFRRLQGKTQVLGVGESDFYRTRLTHSLEVAQLSSGILEFLKQKYKKDSIILETLPSPNLIEAIGLAHDIGHPPFGHGGEVALNWSMRDNGGFEGNAQNLRICTELGEYSNNSGLNLTRRVLLGILKYPATYSNVVNSDVYNEKNPKNIDSFKPPKCIYDTNESHIKWIGENIEKNDLEIFFSINKKENKHHKTKYKSIDCSIMEIADDVAYGVHDLEDAIALGLVDTNSWNKEVFIKIKELNTKCWLTEKIDELTENLFSGTNKLRKKAIGEIINFYITNTYISKYKIFNCNVIDFSCHLNEDARLTLDIIQEFVRKNVILIPEVQTLEYKGQQMIIKLFDALANNPNRLLPLKYKELYIKNDSDLRIVCDYLSGTTDDYATRLYHKIFTPSSGSIFDKL